MHYEIKRLPGQADHNQFSVHCRAPLTHLPVLLQYPKISLNDPFILAQKLLRRATGRWQTLQPELMIMFGALCTGMTLG